MRKMMEIKLFYINLFINILTFLHRGWKKHSLLCKQSVDHRKAKSPNLVSVLEREKKMFVPEELVNVPYNTHTLALLREQQSHVVTARLSWATSARS